MAMRSLPRIGIRCTAMGTATAAPQVLAAREIGVPFRLDVTAANLRLPCLALGHCAGATRRAIGFWQGLPLPCHLRILLDERERPVPDRLAARSLVDRLLLLVARSREKGEHM